MPTPAYLCACFASASAGSCAFSLDAAASIMAACPASPPLGADATTGSGFPGAGAGAGAAAFFFPPVAFFFGIAVAGGGPLSTRLAAACVPAAPAFVPAAGHCTCLAALAASVLEQVRERRGPAGPASTAGQARCGVGSLGAKVNLIVGTRVSTSKTAKHNEKKKRRRS